MYEELRRLPLVEVLAALGVNTNWKVRKGGAEHYGTCPLHQAKRNTTSFSFDQEGRFHCFSCNQKGRGAIDITILMRKCSFQEAVTWLEGISRATPESSPVECHRPKADRESTEGQQVVENPPYKASYEKFKVESEWLKARGFSKETLERYGVFQYENPKRRSAYDGQVFIPIRRFQDGEVVGYLIRFLQGEVKYLWPKGVLKSLEVFGSYQLKGQPLKIGYLVESPFAVMKFHQLGFPAVSCYGWSVSRQQVAILRQIAKGWIYLPDSNKRDSIPQVLGLLAQHVWVKAPEYPAQDPEHLSADQIREL